MNMLDWAKKEVEIAVARERAADGTKEDEFSYGGACYESALKAYESLMEDGHSGFSIGLTKGILMRLIDGRPLTPIEDTEDVWNDISYPGRNGDGTKKYQCKRMSSLFKDVYPDGTVSYHDIDRMYCEDINDSNNTWKNGFVSRIIDEMWPINMPYCPGNKPMRVVCEELLTDEKNGDFDSLRIAMVHKPDEDGFYDHIVIGRYFKDDGVNGWKEIGYDEWMKRKEMDEARKEKQMKRAEQGKVETVLL